MNTEILKANAGNYEKLYSTNRAFLRYPADWLIRFWNMYLRDALYRGAKCLDFGCGSGNNAIFLMQLGYNVFGVDVAKSSLGLIAQNLVKYEAGTWALNRFSIIEPGGRLPYKDNSFDFILSNQVLYYFPGADHLDMVCRELHRVLKPGGIVFFTMMGPKNYYITKHTKSVSKGVHDVRIEDRDHRLLGVHEMIYMIKDEDHLLESFNMFEPITTGYFDQAMFDMESNFHWIFAGRKSGAIG